MDPAFELVSFVARSENRLATLQALDERAGRRRDVQEATDIPRATLSRILADCRERDLVERTGVEFTLTPLGHRLVKQFGGLLEDVESHRALQQLVHGLPLEALDVDLFAIEDLSVTLPSRIDPMAPVGRAAGVIGDAALVKGFCYSLLHAPILAMTRDIVESGGRFEGVVSKAVLEVVAGDADLFGPVEGLLETGQAEVLVYQGGIEPQFIVPDDRVLFLVSDAEGAIQGLVETGDPGIHSWALDRFERLRADAQPLDAAALDDLLTA